MEHFYLSLLLLLFVSFVTLSPFLVFHNHRAQYNFPNLPPGRPELPFLGETLDFLSTGWKGRPEKFVFDRVTNFSSEVFKTNIVSKPAVVLAGAARNKFLFSNENKLVVAGLRQQDLPLHAELR